MTTTEQDVSVAPELAGLNLEDKPSGPGAAMMISAGFGILVLGILTTMAEASEGFKSWLEDWQWGSGVGPLAGKTTVATIFYFGCLVSMWLVWRHKEINLKHAFYAGLVLGILGAIGTFPTFFEAFAAE